MSDAWDRSSARARLVSRIVRLVGLLALFVPIMIGEIWPGNVWNESLGFATIVVGDWVPTLMGPTGVALALGVAAVLAAPAIGSWNTKGLVAAIAIRVASSLAVLILVAAAATAWLGIWVADRTYFFIGEPSDSGCQVIGARGSAGFHHASSSLGIVRPGQDRVEWIITNVTTPTAPLQYATLAWNDEVATLTLDYSESAAPFEGLAIGCGAD